MMRRLPVTFALLALSGATALPAQRPQTLSQGPQMRRVFEPVVATARRSVVEVAVGDEVRCLGTAVAPELVLTKYSELHGAAADTSGETPASRPVWTCRRGKQQWICELVDFDQPSDLALLRAVGADLAPITWATDAPTPGAFLATPGPAETPLGIGILSTAPYVHTRPRAFLGVRFANPNGGPAELEEAVPHGAARAAGLLAKDVVIGVDDA
ncbi:MAG: hypothetical protein KDC48_22155, partial [Planctomycetes bacterium]|nr:hypothetical protein [Planctomycetota bacterium]